MDRALQCAADSSFKNGQEKNQFSIISLMSLLLCSLIRNRNATATPRTRHAQLLLPLSWRSGADHAASGMVSRNEIKMRRRVDRVSREQLRSRVLGERHSAVDLRTEPAGRGVGWRRTASLSAQHISNTNVPLHNHTAPRIKVFWTRCAYLASLMVHFVDFFFF